MLKTNSKITLILLLIISSIVFFGGCGIQTTPPIINGTDPTTASTNQASTPLVINSACTVKALAVKAGSDDSAIGSATYTQGFTVTYLGNENTGGTAPTDSNTYQQGADVTVLGKGGLVKTQDGISFLFEGWNIAADGSGNGGTDYTAGDIFNMGSANVILYAQWSALRCTGPAGGLIFYDNGSYTDTVPSWRYLEAAPASTEWTVIYWGSSGTFISETKQGIGTGQSNTTIIVDWLDDPAHTETDRAAQLCNDLTAGGYTDWFLPSKDELNKLYINKVVIDGFADNLYWSSSEYSETHACFQNFDIGIQGDHFKLNTFRVRAVRAF